MIQTPCRINLAVKIPGTYSNGSYHVLFHSSPPKKVVVRHLGSTEEVARNTVIGIRIECIKYPCLPPRRLPRVYTLPPPRLWSFLLGLFLPPRLDIDSLLIMPSVSTETIVAGVGVVAAATYLLRDQIFPKSKSSTVLAIPPKLGDASGDPRDFVAKILNGVSY